MDVDSFVRANIFLILQCKPRRVLENDADPVKIKLFEAYVTHFFGSEQKRKRKTNPKTRKNHLDSSNIAISNWLQRKYDTAKLFIYQDHISYAGKQIRPTDILDPDPCNCLAFRCGSGCPNRDMLVECNSSCLCGDSCLNRESQNTFDWQKYMTVSYINSHVGAGVLATSELPENMFVGIFAGVAITRAQKDKLIRDGVGNYLLEVTKNPKVSIQGVDPRDFGNHTRFINHSCLPNVVPYVWACNGQWVVKFFTTQVIHKVS